MLAYADATDQVTEVWEDNNVASPGVASQVAYQFGNVGDMRNVSLAMLDEFGTPVTFSLRGDGYGEVARNEDGGLDVTYYETSARSTAAIRSPRGANGVVHDVSVSVVGEGLYVLGYTLLDESEISWGGDLRSLNARGIDLTGDLVVDGWVGSVTFDDIATASGLDEYDHTVQHWRRPRGDLG